MTVPPLTGPVNDIAGILSEEAEIQLSQLLRQERETGTTQLTVLTVPSLEGETLESYSLQVVEKWQLGSAKNDSGVLLLIAMKERRMRIEVGQGLEGSLPDAYARRIIDNVIKPYMKQAQYDQAVFNGVLSILEKTDPGFLERNQQQVKGLEEESLRRVHKFTDRVPLILFGILAFVFMIVNSLFRRRFRGQTHGFGNSRYRSSSGFGFPFGSGSGFGGSGGGSSWSGGGGGFSGGGSSGSW